MELARKHGTPAAPKAVFREKLGSADKLFPFIGPVSDLMVVSRPKKGGWQESQYHYDECPDEHLVTGTDPAPEACQDRF